MRVTARTRVTEETCRLKKEKRRAFDRDAGQCSRSPRASVDVDAIVSNVRVRHRCMSVHNESSVVLRRIKELVADPDQVVGILMLERNAWTNAGVHEQEIAANEQIAQTLHEQFVCARKSVDKAAAHVGGRFGTSAQFDAIGCERLHASELLPVWQQSGILQETFHHGLVVAAQAHRMMCDKPDRKQIDHRSGVRPPVDVVAEIDLDGLRDWPAPDVVIDPIGDLAEQISPAMDVTNDIDARIGWRRRGNGV